MKLRHKEDAPFFLADLGRLDLLESLKENEEIDDELFEMFIKRRRPLITGLRNFRKSQLTKQQWRSSRWKFLRGIKKFHRSLAGKRMHRSLGRFLATHITRDSMSTLRDRYESLDPFQFEALKALSSYRTHAYIEEEYYMPLSEAEEYSSFMDYVIPLLSTIEMKVYRNSNTEFDEDEKELMLRLVPDTEICKCLAETFDSRIPLEKIIDTYKGVQSRMLADGSSQDETYFFTHHIENLMPCLLDLYNKTLETI